MGFEHLKGNRIAGGIVMHRAAAGGDAPDHAQPLAGQQQAFARRQKGFDPVPEAVRQRVIIPPFDNQHVFLPTGQFLCHRGAAGPAADNNNIDILTAEKYVVHCVVLLKVLPP